MRKDLICGHSHSPSLYIALKFGGFVRIVIHVNVFLRRRACICRRLFCSRVVILVYALVELILCAICVRYYRDRATLVGPDQAFRHAGPTPDY